MNEEEGLMGWGPFTLSADHPFALGAKLLHDPVYQAYLDGKATTAELIKSDIAYYRYMKSVAKERKSLSLRIQAHTFYLLIKAFRLIVRMPGDGKLDFPT